ncbi:MAG TPA: hypothetical protein VED19_01845 [Candidatus Nitrosopolaris sp.]|nr:hypothetical protein [Candidatus Nitrosopolaris sp.]
MISRPCRESISGKILPRTALLLSRFCFMLLTKLNRSPSHSNSVCHPRLTIIFCTKSRRWQALFSKVIHNSHRIHVNCGSFDISLAFPEATTGFETCKTPCIGFHQEAGFTIFSQKRRSADRRYGKEESTLGSMNTGPKA